MPPYWPRPLSVLVHKGQWDFEIPWGCYTFIQGESMGLENGYEYVYLPDCPLAKQNGCVYVHRLVASLTMGRWITTAEHVHHIDGNRLNNDPNNLMVVTRKEHAELEQMIRGHQLRVPVFCNDCGKKLYEESKTGLCANCYAKTNRLFDPTKKELENLIWEIPMVKVARIYGVSDKTIAKRCEILGIKKPPRGYWIKKST